MLLDNKKAHIISINLTAHLVFVYILSPHTMIEMLF